MHARHALHTHQKSPPLRPAQPPTATTPNPLQGSKRAPPILTPGLAQSGSYRQCLPSAWHGQIVACPVRPRRARGANIKTTQPAIEKTFPTDGATRRQETTLPATPRLTAPPPRCGSRGRRRLRRAAILHPSRRSIVVHGPGSSSILGLPAMDTASVSEAEPGRSDGDEVMRHKLLVLDAFFLL